MNYYEILGVKTNATEAEIRTGYIRESLKWHPDRQQQQDSSTAASTAQFQKVADAYFVLSDKERRVAYDSEQSFVFDAPVNPIAIFGEIFNDLMVPEVPNPSYWWQPIGTVSGVMLGFIVLNVPGAIMGGYYGNRAGKVRDMKGVSVYDAYCKLSTERRQEILSNLGKKFLSAAISSSVSS